MKAEIQFGRIEVVGEASCIGGKHPDPPLDGFPLLAWSGNRVHTEDGMATVEDIAISSTKMPDSKAIAQKHSTTEEHVRQAVAYAFKAKFLGPK